MRPASLGKFGLALTLSGALVGCSTGGEATSGPSTFKVVVTRVDGSSKLPSAAHPLPANRGDHDDTWEFTVEAVDAAGRHQDFDGVVRLSAVPGALLNVAGDRAHGRNLQIVKGKGSGVATVTATYGASRLWVEDIGYVPAPAGKVPQCSNGKNDDPSEDKLVDFPADPGCAFADDDTEKGGSYAAGVSNPVEYALPSLVDVQGQAAGTPYAFDAIEVNTSAPHDLVVTRVSADGFFVTDLADQAIGYNHLFAFNFSAPADMKPCDKVTYLSGTVNEFFGFTELNFPSYQLSFPILHKDKCAIPAPAVLDPPTILDDVAMEKVESGLVRIQSCLCDSGPCDDACKNKSGKFVDSGIRWAMPTKFGPGTVVNNAPTANASSCDLNGDGDVDFNAPDEGSCSSACEGDPHCSEWTTFSARGEIKVHAEDKSGNATGSVIQINLGTATGFDPTANKGAVLTVLTGTLRNFSGGSLNWTIETRCTDDLVCKEAGCSPRSKPSTEACVTLRSADDNDEGTN